MESTSAGIIKDPDTGISDTERAGLKRAGWAILGVVALWVFLCIGPGTPLIDESAPPEAHLNPPLPVPRRGLFSSSSWRRAGRMARAAGTVKNHRAT